MRIYAYKVTESVFCAMCCSLMMFF